MVIFDFALWVLTIPICLCLVTFAAECFLGLRPISTRHATSPGKCAIVVPAHNEELTIGGMLERLLPNCPDGARVIVVADNCTDRTEEIARTHSCEVIVRHDELNRGKGFALARAAEYLEGGSIEVVIVLDADSFISPGGVEALVSQVIRTGQAAQAINLQLDFSNSGDLVRISNFALLVKNLVRCRGLERLSGSSSLFGTGMALPSAYFRTEYLANGNIVDDLALTIDLAREGVSCHLVEQASVCSGSTNWSETIKQRTRWEHGYIMTGMGQALPLMANGLRKGSRQLCLLALDLLIPPLALLVLVSVATLILALTWGFYSAHWMSAAAIAAALVMGGLAVFAAWLVEGRHILPWRSLVQIPIYALRKVPIYAGLVLSRQTVWMRTRRDGEGS